MTSQAYSDLSGRLEEVRVLSSLDPVRSGDLSKPATGNALCRASLVLLSSHLEGYLEDLVSEAIDTLVAHATPAHRLPLLLRAVHTEEHLRVIELVKDRNSRATKIEAMFASESSLWSSGARLTASMVRAKAVCGQMSNPGSREVRQFLEIVGVDIDSHLVMHDSMDLLNRVNGLVNRRNAVAHGEVDASATAGDVDAYLELVESLGRHVDDAVALAVQGICGTPILPW